MLAGSPMSWSPDPNMVWCTLFSYQTSDCQTDLVSAGTVSKARMATTRDRSVEAVAFLWSAAGTSSALR